LQYFDIFLSVYWNSRSNLVPNSLSYCASTAMLHLFFLRYESNEKTRSLQVKAAPLALNLNSALERWTSKQTGRTRSICLSSTARFIAFESFLFFFFREPSVSTTTDRPEIPCGISVIAALRTKTCLNYAPIAISKGERIHYHRCQRVTLCYVTPFGFIHCLDYNLYILCSSSPSPNLLGKIYDNNKVPTVIPQVVPKWELEVSNQKFEISKYSRIVDIKRVL